MDSATDQLSPLFQGLNSDVTEENLQARSRGLLLMAISNKFGALLLTTGNKSEVAVGYCTLYGDMCGGLAVIADVPKTQVFELARHINRNGEIIPTNTTWSCSTVATVFSIDQLVRTHFHGGQVR